MATPQAPNLKLVQYLLAFAFTAQPILLLAFVAPRASAGTGPNLVPIAGSIAAGAASLYWILNRLDADQPVRQFQTNLLISLAFAELPSLLAIFIAWPNGMSPYPFVAATLILNVFAILRINSFWAAKP